MIGRPMLLMVLLLVVGVRNASAQTHPCDQIVTDSARVASTTIVTLSFCALRANAIDAVTVYTGSTATHLSALTQVTPTPNARDELFYEVTIGTFAVGTYALRLSAWNKSVVDGVAQEGQLSDPFSLTVVTPNNPPAAPRIVRVGS